MYPMGVFLKYQRKGQPLRVAKVKKMNNKTKNDIITHVSMKDKKLMMFSTKQILESSIFHQTENEVTAIIGGNEYVFEWVSNEEINHANDFRYVSFSKGKSLVEYY